jgi:hypothetical protein
VTAGEKDDAGDEKNVEADLDVREQRQPHRAAQQHGGDQAEEVCAPDGEQQTLDGHPVLGLAKAEVQGRHHAEESG